MTVQAAFARYFTEVGSHHVNIDTTLADLERLQRLIGAGTPLADIDDVRLAAIIARRRGDGVKPATVNRSVTVRLRAVMTHARVVWRLDLPRIAWKRHILKEPQERVRELTVDEEAALFAALPDGYAELVRFALLSGCRMQECLDLTWRAIDWHGGFFTVVGKGRKRREIPLSSAIEALLWPLPRAHERVFTHVLRRPAAGGARRGERAPIEREGLKSLFDRAARRAGLVDFRFHDLRHTFATRLLRATGDLRTAADILGHADLETTKKYAHATRADMRRRMEAMESHTATTTTRRRDVS